MVGGGHNAASCTWQDISFPGITREPELLRDLRLGVPQGLRAHVRSRRQRPSWVKAASERPSCWTVGRERPRPVFDPEGSIPLEEALEPKMRHPLLHPLPNLRRERRIRGQRGPGFRDKTCWCARHGPQARSHSRNRDSGASVGQI